MPLRPNKTKRQKKKKRMKYKYLTVVNKFQYSWLLGVYPTSSWACPSWSVYSTHMGSLAISRTTQAAFHPSCMVLCIVHCSTCRSQLTYSLPRDTSLSHLIRGPSRRLPITAPDHLRHGTLVCSQHPPLTVSPTRLGALLGEELTAVSPAKHCTLNIPPCRW